MLTKITDAKGVSTAYSYDILGNLLSETDGNGNKTSYEYDALYRIINTTAADGGKQEFLYDAASRLVKFKDALGKMAYREACNRDIIQKNIMFSNNLRCPKSDKPDKKVKALTRSEQAKFVAFLQNYKGQKNRNDYSRQLLIELFTGMRMGEINALTPECVDFEKGVIHIRSTVARGEHFRDFIKNGTKTDAGVRDVPIMKTLEPILKEAINKKSDNPLNLIFYDEQKNGIISTSQVNCFYKRVCEKCGIEKRGQHSLRHTFATRCIEANVPAIVLKKWLGHTDIHITLDTYADVFDSMNNDSIIKVDDYIVNLAG